MPRVAFPERIIIDFEGVKAVNEAFPHTIKTFLYNLMYINTNSIQHKREQVVTSVASYKLILDYLRTILKNDERDVGEWLSAAIRPLMEPKDLMYKAESIDLEADRIWEYAVYLATQAPIQTIICTSEVSKATYLASKIKESKETIFVKSDPNEIYELASIYVRRCKS
ncbi:MAG: hypothetical protein ACREBJ_09305 [Nitrosotalea sp.]